MNTIIYLPSTQFAAIEIECYSISVRVGTLEETLDNLNRKSSQVLKYLQTLIEMIHVRHDEL